MYMNKIWSLVWLCFEVTLFQILQQALGAHVSLKWKKTQVSRVDWRVNGKSKTAASWVLQAQVSTSTTTATSSLFFFLCPLLVFISLFFLSRQPWATRGGSWATLWKHHFLYNQKMSFFFIVPPENNIKSEIKLLLFLFLNIFLNVHTGWSWMNESWMFTI